MATKKANTYIDFELTFLEEKLLQLQKYIDNRPFDSLKDRPYFRTTRTGGSIEDLAASIEVQRKDITQAIKDYAEILKIVKELRITEAKKAEMRKGFEQDDILDEEDDN